MEIKKNIRKFNGFAFEKVTVMTINYYTVHKNNVLSLM